MSTNEIQHILCAVRGIPQSRDTVTYAIQIALDNHARLTFVHVNDARFMANASPTMTSLAQVYKQMRDMSTFTLLVLCDRAKRRGVEIADYKILEGRFLIQIRSLLYELRPDVLVIGKPMASEPGSAAMQMDEFHELIKEIKQNSNITVHPVEINIEGK